MADSTNDDLDRSGNRSTPQGSTPQSPQGRDDMNRDREREGNVADQGRTGNESFNRDSGNRGSFDSDRESGNRGIERERDTDDLSEE